MPKGSKMIPKWMPKSLIFHVFSKMWKVTKCFVFPYETWFWACKKASKINQKSMQNRCWKKAWKNDAKWCQNGAKMGAKIGPISEKGWKKACQKWCWKLKPKLKAKNGRINRHWSISGWIFGHAGGGGLAEFRRYPADLSLVWHAMHPGGVRRIENWSKIRPGGDQWPLILRFLAFWSDAKNTWIFDASPVAQKIRKIGPSSGQRPLPRERGTTFWELGPQGGAFSRAYTRYKGTKNKIQNKKQARRGI